MYKSISKLCICISIFTLLVTTGASLWAGQDWKVLEEKQIKSIDQGISFENQNLGRVKKIKVIEDSTP